MIVAATLPELVAEVIQSDHPGYLVTDNKAQPRKGNAPMWTEPPAFPCRVNLATEEYYRRTLHDALKSTGYWFNGRPSRAFQIVGINTEGQEEEKYAAQSFVIKRECEPHEIRQAIRRNSACFGEFADELANQQWLWYVALGRPERNREAVIQGLQTALKFRGLEWKLEEFPAARDAWDAWDARAARDARDAWDARAAWDARDAWAAWDARAAWAARDARDAWDARAAWDARDALDARAARAALTVDFAARSKCIELDPLRLSDGLRDAYHHGLGIALPTSPNTLGWSMDEETNQ